MKKLFAILLAVSMIMAVAINASAAETTLPDQTFTAWWTGWSQGIEITAEEVTITFDADTDDNTAANYCTPSLVIHSGTADTIGTEYWVQRSDAWGWCYAQNVGDHAAELNALGYSWNYTFEESFGSWDNFQAVTKAGTTGSITAKLVDSNAVIVYKIAGVVNEVTIPVDTTKPVYLALTGESVALTNIKVVTPDAVVEPTTTPDTTNPKDGDSISVIVALMAVSACGIAVVAKKKEF